MRGLLRRRTILRWLEAAVGDVGGKVRHGPSAPVAHERIWVDPRRIRRALVDPVEVGIGPRDPEYEELAAEERRVRSLVGRVVGDEVDAFRLHDLRALRKVRACHARWVEGRSWEESGAIDHMMFKISVRGRAVSGCLTREDARIRYAEMDGIFEAVRRNGRLDSRARRHALFMREVDGVQVHLGRDGEPIFGECGTHRLCIALALGLEEIPASLGFVHASALGTLARLRIGGDGGGAARDQGASAFS